MSINNSVLTKPKFGVRNSQATVDGMRKKQKRLTAEQKEAQQLARVGLHFNTVTKQIETLPIHVTTNVPRDDPDRQVADESDQ